ncbi:linker histone H1 and H5 family-domain-containing protein [Pilobolus umbonatus]|nr:linker histone H1 and H5 family-domain-containing protein [Pilobolus umbonatus]KAI8971124.1 linker histone H1 and H5 family-domain-containing protein [Pilobolus umbonatus]
MTTAATTKTESPNKTAASKKPVEHPPYEKMIVDAILALKERKGSSRPALKKYILANYSVTAGSHFDSQISNAIKRGAAKKLFSLPKGLSGTIKLVKPEKKSTEKKAVEKKATEKKPAEKKTVKKATEKKPVKKAADKKKAAPLKKVVKKKIEQKTNDKKAEKAKESAKKTVKKAAPKKKTVKKPTTKKVTEKANVKAPKKKTDAPKSQSTRSSKRS